MTNRNLDHETLDDIVRRVVEVAQPEKIILFGSAARGEMGPNSDIDLLVVKDEEDSRGLVARIHRELRGVRVAVDAIVVAPRHVERYKDSHALVIKPALREGTVVYEAACAVPPDDPRERLNRARSNLSKAGNRSPSVYLEDICFDAQQAAEKAVKAVLLARGIEFPYVHDLGLLLTLLKDAGEIVPEAIRQAEKLKPYATTAR